MSWTLLIGIALALATAVVVLWSRRIELNRMRSAVSERDEAIRQGSDKAQLQHPVIDLSRCLGCGTCVDVCPENVLSLVHGQAVVTSGARCMGIAACERECPVDAIVVTLADVRERDDIPVLTDTLEATDTPGLFLAGEVTAHALIKTAIEHGTKVATEVARREHAHPHSDRRERGVLDLCIVGAGPAGLACSLEARRNGLDFVTLEQAEGPGGTVAKYPRQKLVITEPVDLPLYGRLRQRTYTKEELIGLWHTIATEQGLPIYGGQVFEGVESDGHERFVVRTATDSFVARNVCLAIGRRGSPSKLGVPGEELPKVSYSLLDAHAYHDQQLLVVGGGDSAVEAALALAEQPGNTVKLSYRKTSFYRLRGKNQERLNEAVAQRRVDVMFGSEVRAISESAVELAVRSSDRPVDLAGQLGHAAAHDVAIAEPAVGSVTVPNDAVFVMIGGTTPIEVLSRAGVSFDHSATPEPEPIAERGTGAWPALLIALGLTLATLLWAGWYAEYYALPLSDRPTHSDHPWLRPGAGAGLAFGLASLALIVVNLLYLVRRSPRFRLRLGSLRGWMTVHVATGILALLLAALHGAMEPRKTPGGRAFWALAVLLGTGAIGRYLYTYVPRAANGRELELAEVKGQFEQVAREWESTTLADRKERAFQLAARDDVQALVEKRQWRGTFFGRVLALCGVQLDLRRTVRKITTRGRDAGVSEETVATTVQLARRAHRAALMAAHYEDVRAVLSSWRFLHRWAAALLVLLVVIHVIHALTYGSFWQAGGAR